MELKTLEQFDAQRESILAVHEETWIHNIPFFFVPVDIVLGFRGNCFTPEEFYLSEIWKEPNHWNAGFVRNKKIVIFMYGHINKLEKYLYAERIGSDKSVQSYGLDIWELSITETERIGKENGCRYIWTTTGRLGELRKFSKTIAGYGAVINPKKINVIRKELNGDSGISG
jgi:hypothetical protein